MSEENKSAFSYLAPLFLVVLVYLSNFLDTKLFSFGEYNFAVWFVISVFCFACGWFINKSLGWQFGGKIVFALIIASSILSIATVIFFNEYFMAAELVVENVVLFALRNVYLGSMGFFGMAIAENFALQAEMVTLREKMKLVEETIRDAKKEADLTLRDAQIRATKILNDAEAQAKNIFLKKERIEKELREFIQIEKELIKKYENNQ